MCNNITNAAPETHATLVATLVINSGSIVVASPTTTPPATNQTSSSILVTPTSTSRSSSSSSTTVAPAAATSSAAAPTTQSTAPNLSQAQIGGIAGGIAAVAVLAALLALFILLKRRHAQRSSPAFARMRESSWSPKRIQGSPGGGSLAISQPHYQEPKVMSFTRALAKRISSKPGGSRQQQQPPPGPNNGFGLAISPGGGRLPGTGVGLDHVVRSPVRGPESAIRNVPSSPPRSPSSQPPAPMSPLRAVSSFNFFPQEETAQTTGKPTLPRLAIPQRASMHGGGRDSVITEFAEDGEDGLGSAQIWRPPNTDPQSASTYYVADKWGNWVLRDERDMTPPEWVAELATPISKTAEERAREREFPVEESAAVQALRHYSSTTVPRAEALPGKRASGAPGGGGRPTIRLVTPESGRLPVNSRVRNSVNASNNVSLPRQVAPRSEMPMPQPSSDETLYGGDRAKGTGRPPISDGTRPPSATTVMSQESSTTIADSPVDDMINAVLQSFPRPARQTWLHEQQQGDLSPVIESPGRSPVQYPAIPRSQSITVNKRKSHTPRALPNPLLARIKQSAVEPAKDSPTLGVMGPVARSGPMGASPNKAAHASRGKTSQGSPKQYSNQNQNPGAARTGPPNQQARKPSDRALLPSQSRMSSYDEYNDPSTTDAPMPSMYAYPTQPPPQRRTPSPGQAYGPAAATTTQQRTISPSQQPYMPSPPSPSEPYYTSTITSPASHYPSTNPSMNSALLAKRIGAERAAEFHIEQQQQQRRQRQKYAQEQDKWARQAGGERYVEMPSLPATPGWKPQLTPKRKGDDLYLSVK
ncbi:hypothetical protein N0V82_008891 [Gnomoniopsis sp. IMI 355080]|nr:hypothetical protein N0V82_008891 [Gnomoniopsis sp. IMI 355080]